MKTDKFFLMLIAFGLAAAGLGLSPARAEDPPTLPLVLDRGQIGTRLDFDFFSGGKYFNQREIGKEAPGGFSFTDEKTTLGLSYGLTSELTFGLSLPVIHRDYTGYYQADEYLGDSYSGGITTTYLARLNIPYTLRKTGIGDVTLETRYRLVKLPGYLPDLAARLAGKLRVGSNGINFDKGELNLGDGQDDLYFGLTGKRKAAFFLYDFSLEYRLRFSGGYSYTENGQTLKISYDPGDEFRARAGAYLKFRQLTLGVSGNYINIGKSRTWLGNVASGGLGAGYYFQLTPTVGLETSPDSSFSFSVEIPIRGRNYPVDSPNPLLVSLFDYRWSLNFQYRI